MATRALIPVEVYLTSVYRPDSDYVDGEVLERNVSERSHGRALVAIASHLYERRRDLGIDVLPNLRIRVAPKRYRVADVSVFLGRCGEQIPASSPFLCVEILSPDDRMPRVWERLHDYFEMGVPNVWVIDPENRLAHIATPSGDLHRVTDFLRTSDPVLEVPLSEIFE